ncbi:hypothetical protein GLYMA_01G122700v4 [Glycine max]|uniref:Uncharacterized protein n=1 Tax=Glycine max TaxID=3847 RepID=A0A0R0LIE3_SOYBN|nr:hypothetical protein GLYMA_01G122700v4 [Glycine max]
MNCVECLRCHVDSFHHWLVQFEDFLGLSRNPDTNHQSSSTASNQPDDGPFHQKSFHFHAMFDTAQSLVSRFLQLSSFFEDEGESPVESDETKVQTWSSQHYRNEPVSGEKPLLLPIRSLKSRLSEEDIDVQSLNISMSSKKRFSSYSNRKAEVEAIDADDVDAEVQSQKRSTSSKRFSSNSNRNTKVEGSRAENKKKESVVLPSPIPWHSRSGRLEHKQEEFDEASNMMFPSSKEESRPVKSQPSCASSRDNSMSFSPSFSLESPAKNAEDSKSMFMKPRFDGSSNEAPSFNKELKRSFTSERTTPVGKKSDEENKPMQGTLFRSNKFMGHASVPLVSQPAEKESLLVEFDDDDDDDDTETEDQDVEGERIVARNNDNGKDGDEGPDVDKKADEFIAKFREQIRLPRIESIKTSTRSARNSSR